ncbi:MAG: YeaH/YhbH family protein [Hydrogenophaga sp.]|uniref:YeaH/YhbH family protein n=1 Tax=Hydrogenophaga sp. TaxID=1904254 RepID=UPI002730C229|nr:YeaH/YhbH family protein [Hydrogenophaga sp.]MDP2404754.1 YeaH/YhbH family protein [Hydrogenophaga sp.]MDZ4215049.1 YeaH/YhbH family protein [Rhodocyclaceae bacterium]
MLQQIVDRRLSGKNKSIGNRERFLRRYREQIRDAVKKAVSGRSIRDIEQGEDITLPRRDVSEPVFGHGQGGVRETVHPGNREYVRGDRVGRPPSGGAGGAGGQGSPDGSGEDDFVFRITRDEFMQIFFDDLALPHLVRTQLLPDAPEWKSQRAGYVSAGNPASLHVVRSMRTSLGRRIAMGGDLRQHLRELQDALAKAERLDSTPREEILALQQRIEALMHRVRRIPFLDPLDLRFRNRVRIPQPTAKAVMFCLMDVSGSMDEERKDIAKRFFILLYLFLQRHYERTDVVFIRHHTQAAEVGETEFFQATESGGTVVSSALTLMHEVIQARYPPGDWNIYGAQASDGENWFKDSALCRDLLQQKLLPLVRYYAYVQVAGDEQNLWEEYDQVRRNEPNFAMRRITDAADIYPVFRELFRKAGTS